MANTSGKHKPPSRIRYEKTHPTVSVRVDETTYRQLKDLKQRSGISMVEILLVGLEKLAPMAGSDRRFVANNHSGQLGVQFRQLNNAQGLSKRA